MSGHTLTSGGGIVFLGSTLDSLTAQMTVQEVQGMNEVRVKVAANLRSESQMMHRIS